MRLLLNVFVAFGSVVCRDNRFVKLYVACVCVLLYVLYPIFS